MSEDPGLNNENVSNGHGANGSGDFFKDAVPESNQGEAGTSGGGGEPFPGFLELVYGVLFEPVKTMKRVAERPPLGTVALVVTILILLSSIMGFLTFSRVLDQSMHAAAMEQLLPGIQALAPFWAVFSFLLGYVKWFVYSSVLHLVADLLGGRGSARGVFAAAGLAGLPSILIIPFQFLGYWYGMGKLAVTVILGLAGLAVGIWNIILLVIGLKAVHDLSTGRSVLTVITPYLALALFMLLMVVALVVAAVSLPFKANLPGYF